MEQNPFERLVINKHQKSLALVHIKTETNPVQTLTFLVNDQRDAQFFSVYLFIFLTLYMFQAHRAHHEERKIVSIQPLVAVILCWWPCRVHTTQPPTATRGCIDTIFLS